MLTDLKVRSAKAAEKPYKLQDADGLHLHVAPSGRRTWRWRYQRAGVEKLIVLGSYPDMSLREAREARDERRVEARKGVSTKPKAPAPTLGDVVRRWHDTNALRWKPHHAAEVLTGIETEILGVLGEEPIDQIGAPAILAELRKLEARGAIDTAHRIRGRLSRVFAFAIGEGLCETNPAEAIKAAMAPIPKRGSRPAATTLDAARAVLMAAEAIPAYPLTRLALRLVALTAVRPGEATGARWREIEGNIWRIPADRMKAGVEHVVPLTARAAEVLDAARSLAGRSEFIFPSSTSSSAPLSENALNVMLRRAGLQGMHVPHGWRATFSTVMNERFPADRLVIDMMLGHAAAEAKGAVEAAYNRAQHMDRRRELATEWAAMLTTGLAPAADLIFLPRKSSALL